MCFDSDSLPPIPVLSGAAVSHDDLVLEARDGNRFAAFSAAPDEPSGAGIVILPDVRGLYRFYEELALRFAERGHAAIAFDYFGRTAGAEKRDDDFEYMPHVEQTTAEGIQADVAAAVARLREDGATSIFTVGFCFGGRHSWLSAARRARPGGRDRLLRPAGLGRDGSTGPTQRAAELEAPILALMGGADEGIPVGRRAGVRARARGGGCRARDRDLRRRSAQLLRPEVRAVRRRLRGRVAARARLRGAAHRLDALVSAPCPT